MNRSCNERIVPAFEECVPKTKRDSRMLTFQLAAREVMQRVLSFPPLARKETEDYGSAVVGEINRDPFKPERSIVEVGCSGDNHFIIVAPSRKFRTGQRVNITRTRYSPRTPLARTVTVPMEFFTAESPDSD